MTMVSASISMFIPGPASHHRRRRGLQDLLQREADPAGPGRQQDCKNVKKIAAILSVSTMTRETLICTVLSRDRRIHS